MNKSQLIVLWIGIAGFVLVGLNPHWVSVGSVGRRYVYRPPTGPPRLEYKYSPEYKFCWGPESVENLLVGWGAVVVVTGGLICTFGVHPDLIQKIRCRILSWLERQRETKRKRREAEYEEARRRKQEEQSSGHERCEKVDTKSSSIKVLAFLSAIVGLVIGVTIAAVSITAISQRYDELQQLTANQVDTVKIHFVPDEPQDKGPRLVLDEPAPAKGRRLTDIGPAPDIFDRVLLEKQVKKDLWIELPDSYLSVRALLVGISAPLAGFFGAWLITWLVGSLFTRPRVLVNRR